MKHVPYKIKRFVRRNKYAILLGGTTLAVVVAQRKTARSWNEFLVQENLTEKYYNIEDVTV